MNTAVLGNSKEGQGKKARKLPYKLSVLAAQTPEKRLMQAILEDAIACLHGIDELPPLKRWELSRSAKRWIMADDASHPLSFRKVCTILRLDPEAVRSLLGLSHNGPLQASGMLRVVQVCARSRVD